jgi:hypothetical protein
MKTPDFSWYKDTWWKADIEPVRRVFGGFISVLSVESYRPKHYMQPIIIVWNK